MTEVKNDNGELQQMQSIGSIADCRLKNMSENRLTFAVDTVRSRLILGCCDGDEQRMGLATHQMVSMNP